jgi:hypothetical protein
MSATSMRMFVFQCSSNTYMECIEKGVFGSNDPWPLQVKKGDHCLLHHYEYDTLLALWQATSDGGKKLVPRAWGGKFPFHVLIALVTPSIVELPKGTLGSLERVIEGERAMQVLDLVRSKTSLRSRT